MDRNQAIGLVIISGLLFIYMFFFAPDPKKQQQTTPVTTDTTAVVNKNTDTATEAKAAEQKATASDSLEMIAKKQEAGSFSNGLTGEEQDLTVETPKTKVTFSNHGGVISKVVLKNYTDYDGNPLVITDPDHAKLNKYLKTTLGIVNLSDLYYTTQQSSGSLAKGDSLQINYTFVLDSLRKVKQTYIVYGDSYQINYHLTLDGFQNTIIGDNMTWEWSAKLKKFEKDIHQSRRKATVNYYTTKEGFDGLSERSTDPENEKVSEPINWIAFKQNFFSSAIINRHAHFASAEVAADGKLTDDNIVKNVKADITVPVKNLEDGTSTFTFFYGPNNYKLLKKVAPDFEKNIYIGWFPVSLVNKYLIINVFHWLENYISNYGIIIIILVFIIKLMLSPLSYKSYVSMAKTKVLKPELDEIKEQYKGNQQKIQAEQMQLYQKVGVNPLSGCIPMLLQMPILFAMFYFFPSSIELRHQPFLWATDLSTYDSIMHLPFTIPLYGDHVSLFTILMTASTLLITWSQGQVSAAQGPAKSISYIMPVVFMFVLNNYPAALSFYYLIANLITFSQQQIIRKTINEDKIKQILNENKKKNVNKKKSKFQQRIEEAMKANEEKNRQKK